MVTYPLLQRGYTYKRIVIGVLDFTAETKKSVTQVVFD